MAILVFDPIRALYTERERTVAEAKEKSESDTIEKKILSRLMRQSHPLIDDVPLGALMLFEDESATPYTNVYIHLLDTHARGQVPMKSVPRWQLVISVNIDFNTNTHKLERIAHLLWLLYARGVPGEAIYEGLFFQGNALGWRRELPELEMEGEEKVRNALMNVAEVWVGLGLASTSTSSEYLEHLRVHRPPGARLPRAARHSKCLALAGGRSGHLATCQVPGLDRAEPYDQ